MVELDTDAPIDLFAYAGIMLFIKDLSPGAVDVPNRAAPKPLVWPDMQCDAVYAF